MLNLTRKKRPWITRKARYMLEAGQIVTSPCDSVDLPEGLVVENKVRFNLPISRFKAIKPVQPYLYKVIDVKSRPEPLSEYKRCTGKDFQPFNALEVDILTYGGAGRGLTEG